MALQRSWLGGGIVSSMTRVLMVLTSRDELGDSGARRPASTSARRHTRTPSCAPLASRSTSPRRGGAAPADSADLS